MIAKRYRFIAAFWAVSSLCIGQSEAVAATPRAIKQIRYVMGTLCEITTYPVRNDEQTGAALDAAFAELKRIDAVLSNWNADSELMRMNLHASVPGNPRPSAKISEELLQRLQVALRIARETDGLFDPTVGPLVRAWGFLPQCPTQAPCRHTTRAEAIAQARPKVGWQKVKLDAETKEVQFAVAGMEVDLGGIAKGYAVERAIEVLKEHGIGSALVNLGNSSLKALGKPACPPAQRAECMAWPVSVVDPRNPRFVAARIYLHDGDALATSGTYENTVGAGKSRRSHLINPYTGEALGGELSVTVLSSDAEVADAMTKPFILKGDLSSQALENILRLYPRSGVVLISAQHHQLIQKQAGSHLESHTEDGIRAYVMARSTE